MDLYPKCKFTLFLLIIKRLCGLFAKIMNNEVFLRLFCNRIIGGTVPSPYHAQISSGVIVVAASSLQPSNNYV